MATKENVNAELNIPLSSERRRSEAYSLKHNVPDGGLGWLVCFACVLMNVINDGVGLSLGLVFVELLDYFKGTKADTSWIVSLSYSVCCLNGPIVAALINQFGSRVIAFVGTLVTVVGVIASIFTPNLYFLYFSLGLLPGLGEIEAAWILSTMAITSTVSRIVFGFISDRKWVNRLYLYSTALVLCGITTSLGPFYTSIASLLIYAVVFGIFSAVIMTLLSVLIADIVGIDNLSRAFGMVNFVSGIAILIGPPIGGWLYDISGTYDGVFLASGICLAFAGAMLYMIPCIDKHWNKR